MTASTRRGALGAILAAPLASLPVVAASVSPRGDSLPDHEARFLALVPQLRRLVPPMEKAKKFCQAVYEEGDRRAGVHPGHSDSAIRKAWAERAKVARDRLGYSQAWEVWSRHADEIDKLVGDLMTERMTTLSAIAWKARVADLLDCWEEEAGSDLAAWAREDEACA